MTTSASFSAFEAIATAGRDARAISDFDSGRGKSLIATDKKELRRRWAIKVWPKRDSRL